MLYQQNCALKTEYEIVVMSIQFRRSRITRVLDEFRRKYN
jgi:hypothetical protein